MPTYRVTMTYEREIEFFVEAEAKVDVETFLEEHVDWRPHDVEGLIDHVGDEIEAGYAIALESKIVPGFRISAAGRLTELH